MSAKCFVFLRPFSNLHGNPLASYLILLLKSWEREMEKSLLSLVASIVLGVSISLLIENLETSNKLVFGFFESLLRVFKSIYYLRPFLFSSFPSY